MGRITASVTVQNYTSPERSLKFEALVDTGASHLVLPSAWKEQLGDLPLLEKVDVEVADQSIISGEFRGPLKVQIEGFSPASCDALFIDMKPVNGVFEPLLGQIVLEQALVAVDMANHQLVPARRVYAK
jgi:hypothetical protein